MQSSAEVVIRAPYLSARIKPPEGSIKRRTERLELARGTRAHPNALLLTILGLDLGLQFLLEGLDQFVNIDGLGGLSRSRRQTQPCSQVTCNGLHRWACVWSEQR